MAADEAFNERWHEAGDSGPQRGGIRWQLSSWAELINDFWQVAGQQARGFGGIDPDFGSKRPDHFDSEHLLNLLGGDGQIFAEADPRREDVAETLLGKLIFEPLHAAILLKDAFDRAEERVGFAACTGRNGTDNRIK